jgi:hypothetical protein
MAGFPLLVKNLLSANGSNNLLAHDPSFSLTASACHQMRIFAFGCIPPAIRNQIIAAS